LKLVNFSILVAAKWQTVKNYSWSVVHNHSTGETSFLRRSAQQLCRKAKAVQRPSFWKN
jgi:hypothetical protein